VIKRLPEDFIVEENANLPLRPRGDFRAYELRKSGRTTDEAIRRLSRITGVRRELFSYGGRKDKHGVTSQFIAVRDPRDISRSEGDFSLRAAGFMERPMGPDLILANAFKVTVRDVIDAAAFERNIDEVRRSGFPNFFDDQRFRSYDQEKGFFAEKILRRHWNGALQVYFVSVPADAPRSERLRKAGLLAAWKDWPACRGLVRDALERRILDYLVLHPKDYAGALTLIPDEEVAMRYAAFQSHLWNELLRRLLRRKIAALEEVVGREGGYLFWRRLSPDVLDYLRSLEVPTAAATLDFPDRLTASLYDGILKEKDIRPGLFRTKALRRVGFRSFLRRALVVPEDLRALEAGDDEFHPGRRKLTLSFSLPRGAYGTMLIKRLESGSRQERKETGT
jgi:tRNA pseudouridine13 synthase